MDSRGYSLPRLMREITRDLNRLAATEDGFKIQRAMPNDERGRERSGRVGNEKGSERQTAWKRNVGTLTRHFPRNVIKPVSITCWENPSIYLGARLGSVRGRFTASKAS